MNNDSNYLAEIFTSMARNRAVDYTYLYQNDNLVRRVVDTFPLEAYATGFKVQGDDGPVYETLLNGLGVWEVFRRASIWARLHGLSCVLMGADGELDTPITGTVQFLKLYGLPNNTDITSDVIDVGLSKVHKSRLLFFKGQEILKDFGEIKVWYSSIIDGLADILDKFLEIGPLALTLLKTSNQVALGTSGLGAGIRTDILTKTTNQRDSIMSRLNSFNLGRSVAGVALFDKDNEVITNTSLSLANIKDLIEVLENQLCLRTDYPKSILFGDNRVGSLSSGTVAQLVERMVWATKLSNWIEQNWVENVEVICNQLRADLRLREFNVTVPLSLILSPMEVAEVNEKQAKILDTIEKYYPMSGEELTAYMANNFTSLYVPPTRPTVPLTNDSIVDELSELANINGRAVDKVMDKIGENSRVVK